MVDESLAALYAQKGLQMIDLDEGLNALLMSGICYIQKEQKTQVCMRILPLY